MPKEELKSTEDILNMMRSHFGNAAKAYWFYDGELCPCCLTNPIGEMMYKNKKALSINAFMYKERGVMIAYILCGECASEIMTKKPTEPTDMHKAIEKNLAEGYLRYVNSLT